MRFVLGTQRLVGLVGGRTAASLESAFIRLRIYRAVLGEDVFGIANKE
jgi:hypothetical protein